MGFLDRFRRSRDPPPDWPEPDDPRVAALAAEIARKRGPTLDWLLWSGPLLGDGDAATEAAALVRRRWWHFEAELACRLIELDERSAVAALTLLFRQTLAYKAELMPAEQASAFAERFIALLPARRRWFTNGEELSPTAYMSDPATRFTFDLGVVAVGEGRAWIAWFTDED